MSLEIVHNSESPSAVKAREKEMARIAEAQLSEAVNRMAANLMRIVAGAGKPENLFDDALHFIEAFQALRAYVGTAAYPFVAYGPISTSLTNFDWRCGDDRYRQSTTDADRARWQKDGTFARQRACEDIADAALRWRAAQLLAQPTQERTSNNALHEAVRRFTSVQH